MEAYAVVKLDGSIGFVLPADKVETNSGMEVYTFSDIANVHRASYLVLNWRRFLGLGCQRFGGVSRSFQWKSVRFVRRGNYCCMVSLIMAFLLGLL